MEQDFPHRPQAAQRDRPRSRVRRPSRLRHSDGLAPKLCRKTEPRSVICRSGTQTRFHHSRIAILRECICLHTVTARLRILSCWSLGVFSWWQAASRAAQLLISCAVDVRCNHADPVRTTQRSHTMHTWPARRARMWESYRDKNPCGPPSCVSPARTAVGW